jgi:two-component system cell cycle response regulator CpdR
MKPLRSVLVVDDDPAMVASASALLRQLGFEVFSVQSAIEALDIVELRTAEIDLLITYLSLTPINGIELVQQVRQLRPQTKVIYMSAAPGADRMTLTEDPSSPLLQKPFTMRELASQLANGLGGHSRAGESQDHASRLAVFCLQDARGCSHCQRTHARSRHELRCDPG